MSVDWMLVILGGPSQQRPRSPSKPFARRSEEGAPAPPSHSPRPQHGKQSGCDRCREMSLQAGCWELVGRTASDVSVRKCVLKAASLTRAAVQQIIAVQVSIKSAVCRLSCDDCAIAGRLGECILLSQLERDLESRRQWQDVLGAMHC